MPGKGTALTLSARRTKERPTGLSLLLINGAVSMGRRNTSSKSICGSSKSLIRSRGLIQTKPYSV